MPFLDSDEKIIGCVRKHWFILFSKVFFLFVLAIAPIIAAGIFEAIFKESIPSRILGGNNSSILMFFYSLWLLTLWVILFFEWTDYYFDVWYVTDKRVINVNQKGVFHREIGTVYYENIRDVFIKIEGVMATLLKFGTIELETMGEMKEFVLKNAMSPEDAKNLILGQYRLVTEKQKPAGNISEQAS